MNHGTNRLVAVTRDAGPAPVVMMPASEQAQAIAAKAVALHEAGQPPFRAYQQQVVKNAQTMADVLIAFPGASAKDVENLVARPERHHRWRTSSWRERSGRQPLAMRWRRPQQPRRSHSPW